MKQPNPKLLADLVRLSTKYQPRDWEQLSAWLDDEKQRERLRALLLELVTVSRSRRKPAPHRARQPGPASRLRDSLTEIRGEDAERADLLEDIWLKLRERELLPTIAAVRTFADAMGSKRITSGRRDQAVTELMEQLIELPGDALEQRMRQTVVADRKLGEEYEQWVQLILGRRAEVRELPLDP
jgi:hypothetical protein